MPPIAQRKRTSRKVRVGPRACENPLVSGRSRMRGIGLAALIGSGWQMKVLNPPAPLQVSLTSESPVAVVCSPGSL
jgi:hypothetical protein